MRALVVWATGPGLFLTWALALWAGAAVWRGWRRWRRPPGDWQASIDTHADTTRALRAVHDTPGGLADRERGA